MAKAIRFDRTGGPEVLRLEQVEVGDPGPGEVGNGAEPGRVYGTPVRVSGPRAFREVVAHARHSCGITDTGSALCWGRNATGETGSGGWAPVELAGGLTFRSISTGSLYTCATSDDGRAACFGDQSGGNASGSTGTSTPG